MTYDYYLVRNHNDGREIKVAEFNRLDAAGLDKHKETLFSTKW